MVQLILEGEGLSIKEEISRLQALQILAFVDTNANSTAPFSPSGSTVLMPSKVVTQALGIRQESPGEFLRESGATTNPEKILALASYYSRINSDDLFTPVDIQRLFERAREVMPKNFGRDFRNTLEATWIDESTTEAGKYWITKTGEQALADKFVGAARASKGHTTGANPKRQPVEDVFALEAIEELNPIYWSGQLQTEAEKILFILHEAKKRGKPELKTSELSAGAVQLGAKPFTGITAFLSAHKGKWMKTPTGYKILQPGITYIEERLAAIPA